MANAKLDTLDYKILKMLSIDARKPYLEVARACGVSGAAIHQRIQKLYSMGVVRGSITLIDPSSVGFDTCAYVGIFLYDMFVKLYAKNNDHLLHLIHDKFLTMGLGRTETLITFKEVFKRQIPVED